jgi:glyoxylase-like metal-dependent hydrolase (beta-lactamase superfamily II)
VTALRSDGHTPGHQSLLVELADTGPVLLTADACYWQEHFESERVPGVVWNPTLAQHSIKRLKTLARLTGARVFPGHDPEAWRSVKQSPDAYR